MAPSIPLTHQSPNMWLRPSGTKQPLADYNHIKEPRQTQQNCPDEPIPIVNLQILNWWPLFYLLVRSMAYYTAKANWYKWKLLQREICLLEYIKNKNSHSLWSSNTVHWKLFYRHTKYPHMYKDIITIMFLIVKYCK